jgi:hypothetical protein
MDRATQMTMPADKHETITRMLDELQAELGGAAFDVVDHWDDSRAIGVARPDDHGVLAYISTHDSGKNKFWVSLELPPRTPEEFPYLPAGDRQVNGIQELAAVVRTHFEAKNASIDSDPS